MSHADKTKWDARYAAGNDAERAAPSDVVRRWAQQIPPGPALDVACGAGRNALLLAECGYAVDAVDISPVGLERARRLAADAGVEVAWHCQDLLEEPVFPRADYALICMIRFVALRLLTRLPAHLAPGGVLIVEEHMQWPEPVAGPRSARFRVAPGELEALLPDMAVVEAFEGETVEADGTVAAVSRLVVQKAD